MDYHVRIVICGNYECWNGYRDCFENEKDFESWVFDSHQSMECVSPNEIFFNRSVSHWNGGKYDGEMSADWQLRGSYFAIDVTDENDYAIKIAELPVIVQEKIQELSTRLTDAVCFPEMAA